MKLTHQIGLTTLGLVAASTIGIVSASAQTTNAAHTNFVQSLASKLGISEDNVQNAVDQLHTEQQAQRRAAYESKLTQLVTDGKITEAQKQLIIAKHKELETQREQHRKEFQNLTAAEHRTKMETERTELENWAKANNIDLQYLRFGIGRGPGLGQGMGHRHAQDMMGIKTQ